MNDIKRTAILFKEQIEKGEDYWKNTSNKLERITLETIVDGDELVFTLKSHLSSEVSGLANLNRFHNEWTASLTVNGTCAYHGITVRGREDLQPMLEALNSERRDQEYQSKEKAYDKFIEITS